jgi:hypothetical protein
MSTGKMVASRPAAENRNSNGEFENKPMTATRMKISVNIMIFQFCELKENEPTSNRKRFRIGSVEGCGRLPG